MLHAAIMAGGSGTRFWPKSREKTPKQLIHIAGEGTMIQQTVERLEPMIDRSRIYVITTGGQEHAMREQLPQLPPGNILAEPVGRDSAPCIGMAAIIARKTDPDGVILMCPADHIIRPAKRFAEIVQAAEVVVANMDLLGTFGIRPAQPSTAYGYIQRGDEVESPAHIRTYRVKRFVEKPELQTARKFLESGDYYWNSGVFIWSAKAILAAIEKHMPDLRAALARIEPALGTPEQNEVIRREYEPLQKISIDYGVMEKADNVIVLEADYEWDDVGSWLAVERLRKADASGNIIGGRHEGINTRNSILMSEGDHIIATIGVSDLIIVHTPDATLVCAKENAADVKQIVENLRQKGLTQYL